MFTGIKRVARAIFVDDLRLRRDERGLRIVLENTPPSNETPVERALREATERRERQVQDIRDQLAALFASQPGMRQKLVHLAYVEGALAEQGLALVDVIPLAQLRAALEQFEATVVDWSPAGLAYLRSRMAVAVRERSPRESGGDIGDTSALPVVREIDGAAPDEEEAALLAAYGGTSGSAARD